MALGHPEIPDLKQMLSQSSKLQKVGKYFDVFQFQVQS